MKKLLLLLIAIATISSADAQFIKRMADRAKNRIEQKAGEKVDKGVDEATDVKKKEKEKKSQETDGEEEEETASTDDGSSASSTDDNKEVETGSKEKTAAPALKAYSKYDFVPGDKVIAFEDFSSAEVGDFPLRWNTNATGEVVTLSGKEGKWFQISKEGVYYPEFITELPENFTLEFDLGVNNDFNSWPLEMNIAKLRTPEDFADYGKYVSWKGDHAVHINFKPAVNASGAKGNSHLTAGKDGNHMINNDVEIKTWNNKEKTFAHISIWRQKQRLRVYVNNEKIWDLPRGFDADASAYNAITFASHGAYHTHDDFYLLDNIRLAVGSPDTRTKLITEGKFVTSGILFDVNKDVVKPESYGTLKDIATVLKENAGVKVKIIGHTDSDGDENANLELSKKRAAAVKDALSNEFGIDASRMETDGKGESQPADKNDTPIGKANNRRVEFVKL